MISGRISAGTALQYQKQDTEYGRPMKPFFNRNPELLGLGKQIGQIWGIWGIFGQTISAHFGTMCSIYFYKKTKPSTSQMFIWDWHLNLGHKELEIQPSHVSVVLEVGHLGYPKTAEA